MDRADSAEADDRPIPFVLRVATDWIDVQDELDDNFSVWLGRTRLTGELSATSDGLDLQFSDLGVTA